MGAGLISAQPIRVQKLRLLELECPGPAVHLGDESADRVVAALGIGGEAGAEMLGHGHGGVITGREQHAVEQLADAELLAGRSLDELPVVLAARSEKVTVSSSNFGSASASFRARKAVMILVVLAIARGSFSWLPHRTLPVAPSAMAHALAETAGGPSGRSAALGS